MPHGCRGRKYGCREEAKEGAKNSAVGETENILKKCVCKFAYIKTAVYICIINNTQTPKAMNTVYVFRNTQDAPRSPKNVSLSHPASGRGGVDTFSIRAVEVSAKKYTEIEGHIQNGTSVYAVSRGGGKFRFFTY